MTLRVRTGAAHTPALRARLAALLASADVRPPGVPAAAVLIVRHMDDPLPGRVAPRAGGPLVDPAWERAAHSAIDQLYRGAARPARGQIPDDPEAVLFADEAELLAYLALDLCRGIAWQHWWWRAVLRGLPPAARSNTATLLIHEARAVPAALHELAGCGAAAEVVGALAPAAALAVLEAIGRAYAIDVRRAPE